MTDERDDPTPLRQRMAMAAAIKSLREALPGQPSPGDVARPVGWTAQTWRNYENGDRQTVLSLDVQQKVCRALGVSHEQLMFEYRRQLGDIAAGARFEAMADRGRAFAGLALPDRRAVFPLNQAEAVLTYPSDLSDQEKEELADYLTLFARTLRRPAA